MPKLKQKFTQIFTFTLALVLVGIGSLSSWKGENLYASVLNQDVGIELNSRIENGFTIGSVEYFPLDINEGVEGKEKGGVFSYRELWDGVDLELKILENGIKEDLVLKKKTNRSSFDYLVRSKNLTLSKNELGGIDFWQGNIKKFYTPPPNLTDGNGTYMEEGLSFKLEKLTKGEWKLSLVIDSSILDNLSFPVVIDPTVYIEGDGGSSETVTTSIGQNITTNDLTVNGNLNIDGANLNIDSNTLYVDAENGRVGIANSAPTTELEVSGSISTTTICDNDGANCSTPSQIASAVGGGSLWDTSGSDLYYNDGNVGIGTSEPNQRLEISDSGDSATYLHFSNSDTGETGNDGADIGLASNEEFVFINRENTNIKFEQKIAGNNFNFVNGNVGIGTSTPSEKLHVETSSGQSIVLVKTTASANAGIVISKANDSTGTDAIIAFKTGSAETERFRIGIDHSDSNKFKIGGGGALGSNDLITINSSGNVGIGTASPTATLHVNGTAIIEGTNFLNFTGGVGNKLIGVYVNNNDWLTIGGGSTNGKIRFVDGDDPSLHYAYLSSTNGLNLLDDFGGNIKINLNPIGNSYFNAGNVGIGTSSPDTLLSLFQDTGAAGDLLHLRDTTDGTDLVIRYNGGNYALRSETSGGGNEFLRFSDGLKLMPDASGDVELFSDTDVGDDEYGKIFKIHRKAVEGDSYLEMLVNANGNPLINTSSGKLLGINGSSIYFNDSTGGNVMLGSAYMGLRNPAFKHYGYITATGNEKYVQWKVDDTYDEFVLSREDSSISGFRANMPFTSFMNDANYINVRSWQSNASLYLNADESGAASGANKDPRLYFKYNGSVKSLLRHDVGNDVFVIGSDYDQNEFEFDVQNGDLNISGDTIRIQTSKTPSSSSDTCSTGEIVWDANYVYVCTATNTWKRSALASW